MVGIKNNQVVEEYRGETGDLIKSLILAGEIDYLPQSIVLSDSDGQVTPELKVDDILNIREIAELEFLIEFGREKYDVFTEVIANLKKKVSNENTWVFIRKQLDEILPSATQAELLTFSQECLSLFELLQNSIVPPQEQFLEPGRDESTELPPIVQGLQQAVHDEENIRTVQTHSAQDSCEPDEAIAP